MLVTKVALRARVWPGVIVDENNLQVQLSSLRRALDADCDWIATIPGRGYRFIGPIPTRADELARSVEIATGELVERPCSGLGILLRLPWLFVQ